jgi:type IV pilus assembly protein PilP
MTSTRLTLAVLLSVSPGVIARAQQPAKPAAPPSATAPARPDPKQALPVIDPAYVYEPAGRRDPFISLLGRGQEGTPTAARPAGVPGLLIGEVTVKGVLKDRAGFIALLQAPDRKTYNVRVGDRLFDGTVKSINEDKVVFSQDVNDPLSLIKQREVPKPVRQAEGRG